GCGRLDAPHDDTPHDGDPQGVLCVSDLARHVGVCSTRRATSKLNIMPLWLCSAMWQCAIQRPGFDTSRRMSTVCPDRTRTVSFHTRLSSGSSSLDKTRN